MKQYFTLGQVHRHELLTNDGETIYLDKDSVVEIEAPSAGEAREKFTKLCNHQWAFQYDQPPKMEYFPRGIIPINPREVVFTEDKSYD